MNGKASRANYRTKQRLPCVFALKCGFLKYYRNKLGRVQHGNCPIRLLVKMGKYIRFYNRNTPYTLYQYSGNMNITELTNPDCQHRIINCHVELPRPEEAIFALTGSCLLLLLFRPIREHSRPPRAPRFAPHI